MGAGRLNHHAPIHRHKVNSAEWTRVEFRLWLWDRTGVSAVGAGRNIHYATSSDKKKLDSLFIAITTVQDLQPHLSTRWTGQTHLTISQGAIYESWMARCSPRAPEFSREQYA